MESELQRLLAAVRPLDEAAMEAARSRQSRLAKPPGSLGKLEEISVRLSGITDGCTTAWTTAAFWSCVPTTAWWRRGWRPRRSPSPPLRR